MRPEVWLPFAGDTKSHCNYGPKANSETVPGALAEPISIGLGRKNISLLVLDSTSAAIDLTVNSYLRTTPDAQMRREMRIPAWYLLLVAVLGILRRYRSLRNPEHLDIAHHSDLTDALSMELR